MARNATIARSRRLRGARLPGPSDPLFKRSILASSSVMTALDAPTMANHGGPRNPPRIRRQTSQCRIVARTNEYTVEEVDLAIHAHPTLSEAIAEASLDSLGKMIHA